MAITAAGLTFLPLSTGVTPTSLTVGKFYDEGLFGSAPCISKPVFEDRSITWPDVDGIVNVRHGFRGRFAFSTLIFTGSASVCNSTCKSTMDTLSQNTRYTVSIDGVSLPGCKLVDAGKASWMNISGGCLLVIPCIWQQLSLTN